MPKEMREQDASTKLLTLINVNQARPAKRKRPSARDWHAEAKKAARTAPPPSASASSASAAAQPAADLAADLAAAPEEEHDAADGSSAYFFRGRPRAGFSHARVFPFGLELVKKDSYERHWAQDSVLVEGKSGEDLAGLKWRKAARKVVPGLGDVSELLVEGEETAVGNEEGTSIVSVVMGPEEVKELTCFAR